MWTSAAESVGAVVLICNQRLQGGRRLAEQSLALLILVGNGAGGRHVAGDRRDRRCERWRHRSRRESDPARVSEWVPSIAGIGYRRCGWCGRYGRFGRCRRCWESDPVQVPERVPHITGVGGHRLSVRDDVGLRIGDLGLMIVRLVL